MTETDIDTTYEGYAADPAYVAANRALMETIDLEDVDRIADLACGTGLLSPILLERKRALAIFGIDLDPRQIDAATRRYAGLGVPTGTLADWQSGARPVVHLVTGSAMAPPLPDGGADLAMIGNAIHLMDDKPGFIAEVARILRPGGRLVFNSAFYIGTYPEGTEAVFSDWVKDAVLILREKNDARVAAGEAPFPRQRGKRGRAPGGTWLSPEDWSAILDAAGFDTVSVNHRPVPMTAEGLSLIGRYGGLAEVLLSGYPVEVASACLEAAAYRTFDRLGIAEVPRNWLEMIARRR